MKRKIHVSVPCTTLENPLMVHMSYRPSAEGTATAVQHKDLCRKLYKQFSGSYGYVSMPLLKWDSVDTHYSYFCFTDEQDLLQFLLMAGTAASRVKIWPSGLKFTIHELSHEVS
jgi:hypothetical protein